MSNIINVTGPGTTNGTTGSDSIFGTNGPDDIYGRDGDDFIYGYDGGDNTRGEGGADTLYGGAGNDLLDGGAGADTMYGGADNDTYIVDDPNDLVIEVSGEGGDVVRSFLAYYVLPDNVEIYDAFSTTGITGVGNALNNSLRGNALANTLNGMAGSDSLSGQGGDDILIGGSGAFDNLTGGTGADRFEFSAVDSSLANARDTITDLKFGEGDSIALFGLGAGGTDVVLASYKDVYAYVRATPGVLAATNANGNLLLTIPNGGLTQIINIADGEAWKKFQDENPAPVATNDGATTDENSTILVDVLGNDVDDTVLKLVSATGVAGQGTVVIENGQIRFDPGTDFDYLTPGQSAQVAVSYQVVDAFGKTATATLTITVEGRNEGAVIGGVDTGSVTEDGQLVASGTLTIDDVDGPETFAAGTYAGKFGALQLGADGNWTYTLNNSDADLATLDSGESEIDAVTVKAADGTTHQIKVTVNGANEIASRPEECTRTTDGNNNDGFSGGSLFNTLSSSQLSRDNLLRGTAGNDVIDSKARNDVVYAGAGNDTVDGGQGEDIVYGGTGNDKIEGGQGEDVLYGGSGRDEINGGQGDDLIFGGFGADILTGHQGVDRFAFTGTCDTNDLITDFGKGEDLIDLSQFKVDGADFNFSGLVQSKTFAAGQNLIWFQENGKTVILGNTDDDPNTAELMITLNGTINLTVSDFLL